MHRPAGAGDPAEIVRRVAGIQAQDPAAARLGIRARSARVSGEDVDRARAEQRSIVRTWAMRGTLHLLATEDHAWLFPLFAERQRAWSRQRLEALGVPASVQDRALKLIAKMLGDDGLVARRDLLDRLAAGGIEFERETAGHHLPRLAVLAGVACLGPDHGLQTTYVPAQDWIGAQPAADRERSLAELARRYVGAFGPADEMDMAAWAGLGVRDCRGALGSIAAELAEVRVGGRRLVMLRAAALREPRRRLVRLVPAFDNYLLGHAGRGFAVTPKQVPRIWPGGGIIRPTVLVGGVVAGTWRSRRVGGRLRLSISPFEKLDADVKEALAAEADDIGRFEGLGSTLELERGG